MPNLARIWGKTRNFSLPSKVRKNKTKQTPSFVPRSCITSTTLDRCVLLPRTRFFPPFQKRHHECRHTFLPQFPPPEQDHLPLRRTLLSEPSFASDPSRFFYPFPDASPVTCFIVYTLIKCLPPDRFSLSVSVWMSQSSPHRGYSGNCPENGNASLSTPPRMAFAVPSSRYRTRGHSIPLAPPSSH